MLCISEPTNACVLSAFFSLLVLFFLLALALKLDVCPFPRAHTQFLKLSSCLKLVLCVYRLCVCVCDAGRKSVDP